MSENPLAEGLSRDLLERWNEISVEPAGRGGGEPSDQAGRYDVGAAGYGHGTADQAGQCVDGDQRREPSYAQVIVLAIC